MPHSGSLPTVSLQKLDFIGACECQVLSEAENKVAAWLSESRELRGF